MVTDQRLYSLKLKLYHCDHFPQRLTNFDQLLVMPTKLQWQYRGGREWFGPGVRVCVDPHPLDLRKTLPFSCQSP